MYKRENGLVRRTYILGLWVCDLEREREKERECENERKLVSRATRKALLAKYGFNAKQMG